jgi:hypothetical protein
MGPAHPHSCVRRASGLVQTAVADICRRHLATQLGKSSSHQLRPRGRRRTTDLVARLRAVSTVGPAIFLSLILGFGSGGELLGQAAGRSLTLEADLVVLRGDPSWDVMGFAAAALTVQRGNVYRSSQ